VIHAAGLYLRAAARDRGVLLPLAALALALLGVFAYKPNEVGETWALTALLAFGLTAWLHGAVLRSMPEAERDMVTAALGGLHASERVGLLLGLVLAAGVAAVFLGYPLAIDAFDRPAGRADVLQAAGAHLVTGLLGAQLARLASPPLVRRRASAASIVAVAVLASIVGQAHLGPLAGPMSVSAALVDGAAVQVLVACMVCLGAAAALELGRALAVRRLG